MEKIMSNSEVPSKQEEKPYVAITFDEEVEFKYTLPDDDEQHVTERELTFIWEDTIEKFIEEHGTEKPYKVNTFKMEQHYNFFVNQVEDRTEALIEDVEEEIANKTKFGFDFSGQLHNDD